MTTSSSPSSSDRWLYLIGGVSAIVGSLLGMVGNLIHPDTPIGDATGVAVAIAGSDSWLPIHLAIIVGIVLMFLGLVALAGSVRGELAAALARLGLAVAIAGVAIGLILVVLDGVATRELAQVWAMAPPDERATALRIVAASESLNFALASLFNIVFAGVAFILFGLAVGTSEGYPRWLGLVVVFGGLESIAAGFIQAEAGEPIIATRVLTIIGPTVITLWLLVMGILLVRKARPPRESTADERGRATGEGLLSP